jgi:hypothetical protein
MQAPTDFDHHHHRYTPMAVEELMTDPVLLALDHQSWTEKFEYAAHAAQPLLDSTLPARFPTDTARTTSEAGLRILNAAVHMLHLCGFGMFDDPRAPPGPSSSSSSSAKRRSIADIVAWRDVWTHPELYRRVFSDWIGTVYRDRADPALEEASRASADLSRASATNETVHWTAPSPHRRPGRPGPPRARPGVLGPYEHPDPERFGHQTTLVHVTKSTSGALRYAQMREAGASSIPTAVVRIITPEWYIRGFLPSVLLWAHLAMVEAPRVRRATQFAASDDADATTTTTKSQQASVELNLFLFDIISGSSSNIIKRADDDEDDEKRQKAKTKATSRVSLDPELQLCWERLSNLVRFIRADLLILDEPDERLITLSPTIYKKQADSKILVPDMVRIPQELWAALSESRWGDRDVVRLEGIDGLQRWSQIERLTEGALLESSSLMPEWIHSRHDDENIYAAYEEEDSGDPALRSLVDHRISLNYAIHENTRATFPEKPFLRGITDTARLTRVTRYLLNLEAAHRKALPARDPLERNRRNAHLVPPERYLPLPQPPHPVPGLYIPWTFAVPYPQQPGGAGSTSRLMSEVIMRPEAVRTLRIARLGIACLETGLAIEEWGRCWNDFQRAEHHHPPRHADVVRAVRAGQSVRGIDIDFPHEGHERERLVALRNLHLAEIMVLDPEGPMGRGHRIYSMDQRYTELGDSPDPNWPRGWARPPSAWWLRLDRLCATEYLSVTPLPVDAVGRWEDTGLEVPQALVRDPDVDRPLRFCRIDHLSAPDPAEIMRKDEATLRSKNPGVFVSISVFWEQAHWRFQSRIWTPTRIDPWPVYAHLSKVNVALLDTAPIAAAPVLRQLHFTHVFLPRPTWFRELLEYPIGARGGTLEYGPAQWTQFLKAQGAPWSLMPSARLTLLIMGMENVQRYVKDLSELPSAADREDLPGAVTRNLLPGVPLPARDSLVDRELIHTTRFRHYPNLGGIILIGAKVVDIPYGVLDLWISGTFRVPSGRPQRVGARGEMRPERVNPPMERLVYCDLSYNRISAFSTLTWVSLVLMVRVRYEKMLQLRRLRGTPGAPQHQVQYYLQHTVVNMRGNPILEALPGKHIGPGGWGAYIEAHLDAIADKYRAQIAAVPRGGEVCCPAVTAMRFWKAHRKTVLVYLRDMFVDLDPDRLRQHIVGHYHRINLVRNAWMI